MTAAQAGQCIVIPGPGVHISWIQTIEGFPCLIIQPTSDQSAPLFEKTHKFGADKSSTWTYDEVPHTRGVITFHGESESGILHEPRDEEKNELYRLRRKIDAHWPQRAKVLQQTCAKWTRYPADFYGIAGEMSGLQYSFKNIMDSSERREKDRRVMAMAHLADRVRRSVDQGMQNSPHYRESACRRALFEELYAGAGRGKTASKKSAQRAFDYAVEGGRVINTMDNHHAAFSLAIAPLLSRDDLLLIRNHLGTPFPWIDTNILEEISIYASTTQAIRTYLWDMLIYGSYSHSLTRSRIDASQGLGLGPDSEGQQEDYGWIGAQTAVLDGVGAEERLVSLAELGTGVDLSAGTLVPITCLPELGSVREIVQHEDNHHESPICLNQYTNINDVHIAGAFGLGGWSEPGFI